MAQGLGRVIHVVARHLAVLSSLRLQSRVLIGLKQAAALCSTLVSFGFARRARLRRDTLSRGRGTAERIGLCQRLCRRSAQDTPQLSAGSFILKRVQEVYTASGHFYGPFPCDHPEIDTPVDLDANPRQRTAAESPSVGARDETVTFGQNAKGPYVSVPLIRKPPPPDREIIFSSLSCKNSLIAFVAPGQLVNP